MPPSEDPGPGTEAQNPAGVAKLPSGQDLVTDAQPDVTDFCNSASLRCLCLGQAATVFGFLEEEGGWGKRVFTQQPTDQLSLLLKYLC